MVISLEGLSLGVSGHYPVTESVCGAEDEGVAVGESGGDVADEERLLRLRDAEVEVVVPGDEAAMAGGAERGPTGGPAGTQFNTLDILTKIVT